MSLIETAEMLDERGDYFGSLELLLEILENEPDNVKALRLKADLLCVVNRPSESIKAYKKILRFYESNDKVWSHLYVLKSIRSNYRSLRDYNNAIVYCEKSIELCERFLKIESPQKDDFIDQLIGELWILGEYQYKSRKYSRAIDTYKKLLKLQSEFGCLETIAEVLYELACAYYKLNRTTEALNKYSETLKIREVLKDSLYTPWAHYYVASIHFAARDYKKALFHVEKSVLLLEKMFGKINDLGVEDSPVYRRAKRLLNSLEKNKLLWEKSTI